MTAHPDPIPANYRRVTPCLVVRGAGRALEFYADVFGASERMRFPGPDGTVAHAEIQIGDAVVIVEDEDPHRGTTAPPDGGRTPTGRRSDGARAADECALALTANPAEQSLLRRRLTWA